MVTPKQVAKAVELKNKEMLDQIEQWFVSNKVEKQIDGELLDGKSVISLYLPSWFNKYEYLIAIVKKIYGNHWVVKGGSYNSGARMIPITFLKKRAS
jgi:hypothetical protein